MFFFIFGSWLLPEKFSFCPKNNGFARVWGVAALPSPLARTPMTFSDRRKGGQLLSCPPLPATTPVMRCIFLETDSDDADTMSDGSSFQLVAEDCMHGNDPLAGWQDKIMEISEVKKADLSLC